MPVRLQVPDPAVVSPLPPPGGDGQAAVPPPAEAPTTEVPPAEARTLEEPPPEPALSAEPPLRPAAEPARPTRSPSVVPIVSRPVVKRFRVARAYGAALRVALSYWLFHMATAVRGPAWAARRRDRLHARNGRRVREAILRLRGLFIKAGQLASALTNFLPEPFRAELEGLQDQVPAGPLAHAEARIRSELGAEAEALFATLSSAPVASASLAQVHRGTTPDGRDVAVKVQHADIEAVARLDLKAIRTILRVVGRWFGIRGLRAQMDEIEAVILAELDFRQEAAYTAELGANLESVPGVSVPEVVTDRSSRRVLTTAWVDAIKVGDLAALDAAGIDRTVLAERIFDAYGRMIFSDGLYHADPHPGNLLVQPRPEAPDGFELVFLDFGAVARLTPEMRRGLAAMLAATIARDASGVVQALGMMGFVATSGPDANAAVVQVVESVHEQVLRGMDPSNIRLADFGMDSSVAAQEAAFEAMDSFDLSFRDLSAAFRVPRDWILFERTALLLLGLGTTLAPDLNPFGVLWPYVEPLLDEAKPAAKEAFKARAFEVVRTSLGLPGRLDRVLGEIERGEVAVRSPDVALAADRVAASVRGLTWMVGAIGSGGLAVAVGSGAGAWLLGGLAVVLGLGALASLRR